MPYVHCNEMYLDQWRSRGGGQGGQEPRASPFGGPPANGFLLFIAHYDGRLQHDMCQKGASDTSPAPPVTIPVLRPCRLVINFVDLGSWFCFEVGLAHLLNGGFIAQ